MHLRPLRLGLDRVHKRIERGAEVVLVAEEHPIAPPCRLRHLLRIHVAPDHWEDPLVEGVRVVDLLPDTSDLTESGLITNTNAGAPSMAALISLIQSAVGLMPLESTQAGHPRSASALSSRRTNSASRRE